MPTIPRRALLIAAVAIAAMGSIVAVLPDRSEPRSEIGTNGPTLTTGPRARNSSSQTLEPDAAAPGTGAAEDQVVSTAPKAAGTRSQPSSTSTTTAHTAPTTGGTSEVTPTTASPFTLRGRIVYAHSVNQTAEIWSMLPDGSDRQRLPNPCPTTRNLYNTLDVSLDGRFVVRACAEPGSVSRDEPLPEGFGIVIQAIDGSGAKTILPTRNLEVPTARFSPDGRYVAITSFSMLPFGAGKLVRIVDLATLALRTIELDPAVKIGGGVTWSPDGKRLLTRGGDIIDLATLDVIRLDEVLAGDDAAPIIVGLAAWAPSGVIYLTEQATDSSLPIRFFVFDGSAGALTRLPDRPGSTIALDFMADGHLLSTAHMQPLEILNGAGVRLSEVETALEMHPFVTAR